MRISVGCWFPIIDFPKYTAKHIWKRFYSIVRITGRLPSRQAKRCLQMESVRLPDYCTNCTTAAFSVSGSCQISSAQALIVVPEVGVEPTWS